MTEADLVSRLRSIDGKGYKAYKCIKGSYSFPEFELVVDHVQGDPFAAPSRLRVLLPAEVADFPPHTFSNRSRQTGLENYLQRRFGQVIDRLGRGRVGSGKSGEIAIDRPGPEVIRRNGVLVDEGRVEVRFTLGLPARGRSVLSREAEKLLLDKVPDLVESALLYQNLDQESLRKCIDSVEDQDFMRTRLAEMGLIAFVGNGAILPRTSGVDQRPLSEAVPFVSPPELEVVIEPPNQGRISGMGLPRGVSLIVGGGFHGKSTLLNAISRGVYNHFPGDGRERVVTVPTAVKVRAEDGRRVENVNITPFIDNLPLGRDTCSFRTDNASGSTSQAANIVEALEVGCDCLLIDEDISATNFMIRDVRMQALVASDQEPITPLVDRIRELYEELGVSTLLVMGGSGDYFDVADRVLKMDSYRPQEVSEQAFRIREEIPTGRPPKASAPASWTADRHPRAGSFDASRGKREVKIDARRRELLSYGTTDIDLSGLEQLVNISQTRAIGWLLHRFASRYCGGTLAEDLRRLMSDLEEQGLDMAATHPVGNLALPRIFELAGAINRMRTLAVSRA